MESVNWLGDIGATVTTSNIQASVLAYPPIAQTHSYQSPREAMKYN